MTPSDDVPTPDVVPDALRDGAFARVRDAWVAGCRARDPHHPELRAALKGLARAARERGVRIAAVLRTLDAVCSSEGGGHDRLDWDHVRGWAGGVVIHAYYVDD